MHVLILGTRGVPAKHGGFETFAEQLATYLTARKHRVTVYCQVSSKETARTDTWNGIERVLLPAGEGPVGTIAFDFAAVRDAIRRRGIVLTLGYNTAIFNFLFRLHRIPNVINMDGIEWKREKWSRWQRLWLRINEFAGVRAGNHLVADNPEILKHLARYGSQEKMSMIPYGADPVTRASEGPLRAYNLQSEQYYLVIARPEPENSILEIVQAFSARKRGMSLVMLGAFQPTQKPYHKKVVDASSEEIKFLGPIYDSETVKALRFHARAYVHGHTVGGTNPSLVESLAAGNAIIAHDDPFNRWVAGRSAIYFRTAEELSQVFDSLERKSSKLERMKEGSRDRHQKAFTLDKSLPCYEQLLAKCGSQISGECEMQKQDSVPAAMTFER